VVVADEGGAVVRVVGVVVVGSLLGGPTGLGT
jgi:hypothetical protein